ncbi:MAG: NAD-binding protein [Candidatus ainarchaeum sp.]|nr:NAD-binding protein [Candidatus ainarchaeum sp.]
MIVIVGESKISESIVKMLSKMNERVVFMAESAEEAMRVSTDTGAVGVKGNPASPADIDELDLRKAKIFVAATDKEETNVLAALYAKDCGVKSVLAIVHNHATAKMLTKLGVVCVDADEQAARMTELSIARPAVAKLIAIGEYGMDLVEISCRGTRLAGKTFGEIGGAEFRPVALYRDGKFSINPAEFISDDAVLIILCSVEATKNALRSLS